MFKQRKKNTWTFTIIFSIRSGAACDAIAIAGGGFDSYLKFIILIRRPRIDADDNTYQCRNTTNSQPLHRNKRIRGNLVLRHSVLHFPSNRGIEC